MRKKFYNFLAIAILSSSLILWGCGGGNNKEQVPNEDSLESQIDAQIDSNSTAVITMNGTLFSIPSPYQIAMLIKKKNIDFNDDLIADINHSGNYANYFKKALAIGFYGADLAYLTLYDQTPQAVKYFSKIKILAQDLDITSGFDKDVVERIDKNMGNKDSLMYIVSNSYRKADDFLKENDRQELGALILTGGFIESLYMITQLTNETKDQELYYRIGEQKKPLDNLIKILSPYYDKSPDYSELTDKLVDLSYDFEDIKISYSYEEPEILPEKKLTIIKSKTQVEITDEQLKKIRDKVKEIRDFIVK
jgi:hypothetical protein